LEAATAGRPFGSSSSVTEAPPPLGSLRTGSPPLVRSLVTSAQLSSCTESCVLGVPVLPAFHQRQCQCRALSRPCGGPKD
jgi:hypothetical protein